jgi:hypothetical protein
MQRLIVRPSVSKSLAVRLVLELLLAEAVRPNQPPPTSWVARSSSATMMWWSGSHSVICGMMCRVSFGG